ncbi:MAG TPA: PfkB family carbohydrate kinase [Mycobacteriales bacterium]|nr:PfkB family carbohydrate kinase [Mycobacteriales bacterium]
MSGGSLVVLGDALLDRDLDGSATRLSRDAPVPVVRDLSETHRPGGAGLAALLAARAAPTAPVVFVTALAEDDGGALLHRMLAPRVRVVAGRSPGQTAEKIRIRSDGQSLLRMDRDQPGARHATITPDMCAAVEDAGLVLVSDYGQGLAGSPGLRAALERAADRGAVVWDPHLPGSRPLPGARMVVPAFAEACELSGLSYPDFDELARAARAARALVGGWRADAVAVTLGPRGALLDTGDRNPRLCPGPDLPWADGCGTGDQFAAAAAVALYQGATPLEAVSFAVDAAAHYAAAGGAAHALD